MVVGGGWWQVVRSGSGDSASGVVGSGSGLGGRGAWLTGW
jgi:hypothetical protein